MKHLYPLIILIVCLISSHGYSQASKIELSENQQNVPGAILNLEATTDGHMGFLTPRMTASERAAISSPAAGLLVYQTDTPKGFYYHNGAAWTPWEKPISGNVTMSSGGSTIDQGEGFTVTHEATGRDLISFDTEYSQIPLITLSSSAIAGVAPSIPNDLCPMQMGNCNVVYLQYLNVDYLNDGSFEFLTGNSFCNVSPGSRTTYKWDSGFWNGSKPASIVAGNDIRFRFDTYGTTNAVSMWADWDQSGSFLVSEQVHSETPTGAQRNVTITVPASACNGYSTVRLVVREAANHQIGCEIADTPPGETEEIELFITGGVDCSGTYPERQTICNVSGLTPQQFRVECSDIQGEKLDTPYQISIIENN